VPYKSLDTGLCGRIDLNTALLQFFLLVYSKAESPQSLTASSALWPDNCYDGYGESFGGEVEIHKRAGAARVGAEGTADAFFIARTERRMEKNESGAMERSRGAGKARWGYVGLVILFIAAAAYAFFGRANTGAQPIAPQSGSTARTLPVGATAAKKGDMSIFISALGTVTPLHTVTVKSRVDGQLMEVLYKEGQVVKTGDLLATIDPRPFQVQLLQAEGQMAHDEALLKNAQLDLERYRTLWQQDSIPKQQLDTQAALVRQYEGGIKTDQAQIENAKLQLTYSRITAPVDGRVGLRLVDPGNIVRASDANGLLVITQLQPITVVFSIAEDNLPPVLDKLKTGDRMPVDVYDRSQTKKLASGSLLTVDNQIDPATGTVRLKAIFDNKDNSLFPNQFVNASLLVNVLKETVIVPAAAIQRGAQGTFVYVVRSDHTAEVRPVTIGEMQGGSAAVSKGLAADELVVVDGAERLREGVKVTLGNERGDRGGKSS
jgi:membrane fusion protein, multidrug efflux system